MDASQSLRATENSLRDVISYVLQRDLGSSWVSQAGLSDERIGVWQSRKAEEERRLGRSDPRLIYYADFYDLKALLRKNWGNRLSAVFDLELREVEVLLDILEEFRNPDAHRRELLPYEIQLTLGITGKLRSQISLFYKKMQNSESYFSRIETIQDSLGNSWSNSTSTRNQQNLILRPGQRIEFNVTASDPRGEPVLYAANELISPFAYQWKESGDFAFEITDAHIAEPFIFSFAVRSQRPYSALQHHVFGKCDQVQLISYSILPRIEC